MSTRPYTQSSPLFLVRLWADTDGNIEATDSGTPLGKVVHVVSGEAHNFEDWAVLVSLMKAMLSSSRVNTSTANSPSPQDAGRTPTDQGR
jgi:hypothetical protein